MASPSDLIGDVKRTPFNVETAIALSGFTFTEADPLLLGLEPYVEQPPTHSDGDSGMDGWTPFLTQKLSALVQQEGNTSENAKIDIPMGGGDLYHRFYSRCRFLCAIAVIFNFQYYLMQIKHNIKYFVTIHTILLKVYH